MAGIPRARHDRTTLTPRRLAVFIAGFVLSFLLLVAALDALEVDLPSVGGAALALGLPTLLVMGYYPIVTDRQLPPIVGLLENQPPVDDGERKQRDVTLGIL